MSKLTCLFASILIAFLGQTLPTQAQQANHQMQVLIPLFIYPDVDNPNSSWMKVANAQEKVNISAIINPQNGAVEATTEYINPNPQDGSGVIQMTKFRSTYTAYIAAIDKLKEKHVKVYGYVSTGWLIGENSNSNHGDYVYRKLTFSDGTSHYVNKWHIPEIKKNYTQVSITSETPLTKTEIMNNIKKEIDIYMDPENGYHMDGIFFDEVDDEKVEAYRELYNYVKGKDATWEVILNPGKGIEASYVNCPAAGDIVVSRETKESRLKESENEMTWGLPSWTKALPPYRTSAMIRDIGEDIDHMKTLISRAYDLGVGYLYLDDNVKYSRLYTKWDSLINHIHKKNIKQINDLQIIPHSYAKEITVGPNNENYVIGTDGNLYKYKGEECTPYLYQTTQDWKPTKIALSDDGFLWAIAQKEGGSYVMKHNGTIWTWAHGQGLDIAVGADGSTYTIGVNHRIYKQEGRDWKLIPNNGINGKPISIEVDGEGNPWALVEVENDPILYVMKWDGSGWVWTHGAAKDFDISRDGSVYVVGTDMNVYEYREDGNHWDLIQGTSNTEKIASDTFGRLWLIKKGGAIYRPK